MSTSITTDVGPCPGGCGHLIRIHSTDASHMGFALALMKARWAADEAATKTITDSVATDELLRSALELALSLTMSAAVGQSGLSDPTAAQAVDRETAGRWLTAMGDLHATRGRPLASRLCRDLSVILAADAPVPTILIHAVDLATALDVCAGVLIMTEERRGVPVPVQFAAYERLLARFTS